MSALARSETAEKEVRLIDLTKTIGQAATPEDLLARVGMYLAPAEVDAVGRAFQFAAQSHTTQVRESGDLYVTHPLAVATILADLRLDAPAITAALLHDVVEDTDVKLGEIDAKFGAEVARLVDGVTKLGRIQWTIIEEQKRLISKAKDEDAITLAENLRKMLLAMAEDIRVVLIKLADRLHNMRTLSSLPPHKRRQIAQETFEIYAPLATRLGIWELKWQLEDLSFRHMEPAQYRAVAGMLAGRRGAREEQVVKAIDILRDELKKAGIRAEVSGRPKHIYSIYRKMQNRGVDFEHIYDLLAIRVIVDELAECYHALGLVHSLWHPIPGQFDDYIATPKESMYQSLHTTVIGPDGQALEIQIRTQEMHRTAEFGIAAHWRYKEGGKRDIRFEEKVAWLRQLIDWQKEVAGGAREFVESVKTDVFQDHVYVFTPKGEIKELPAGATPIDFAYRIHTDVGHRCIGGKVNGKLVSLDTSLQSGSIVEIITSKTAKGPSRDWLNPNLNYVKTAAAMEKIRGWFRKQQRDENIIRGREYLEKELHRLGLPHAGKLEDIGRLFKYDKLDDFLAAIGTGEISPHQVSGKLIADEVKEEVKPEAARPIGGMPAGVTVMGVGDLLTKIARCCNPVPGDPIVGFITRGRGITVHRKDCPNVLAEDERERLVQVDWGRTGVQQKFLVNVRIEAWDRAGLLRDISAVVAEDKINMPSVSAHSNGDGTATILTTLEVPSIDVLSRVLAKIEGIRDVSGVTRVLH